MTNIKKNITAMAVSELKSVFGKKLKEVILYGSYARGDFDAESDVDIMALADIAQEEEPNYRPQVRKISNDIGLDNDIYVSIMLNGAAFFAKKSRVSHFYKNVAKEGKILYAR